MMSSKSLLTLGLVLAWAIVLGSAPRVEAQTFDYIAQFNGNNGKWPWASLVQATDGNFYGPSMSTQEFGGEIFRVTPSGAITALYEFCLQTGCPDGSYPWTPIVGSDGNLYGATSSGGVNTTYGTVFKLTLQGKLTTLHSFACTPESCSDGEFPTGLIQASDGNLYGTATWGGADNFGTVFRVDTAGNFKVLYTFCSQTNCTDGGEPVFPPMQGRDGNLYGATNNGGTLGGGVLYQITLAGVYKVLHNFCSDYPVCLNNAYPTRLVEDASGDFFGSTTWAGSYNTGSVFELTTKKQLKLLHNYVYGGQEDPATGVLLASDGNLYGVAADNANFATATFGKSSIFEVTPAGVYTSLFTTYNGMNGPLLQATDGNFYGTTGTTSPDSGYGTVFKFSTGLGPFVETIPAVAKVGQSVLVLGNGLTGTTSVTFNGVAASFTVESDTYIKATVPAGATTGMVSVETPAGRLNSSPQFLVMK